MEFTKLADVDIVETANDTDKVLIEQNGEIKRVPKTEVGGSGGGYSLVITSDDGVSYTANITLTEAIEAFNKHELGPGIVYAQMSGMPVSMAVTTVADATSMIGTPCMMIVVTNPDGYMQLFWTDAGISGEPPM